jgi:DNA-directed RNA polymerase subunit RPC12/RpoP
MTDQIKISASLQDAQAYMAECLEFVTQDEPFILDFNDSYGSYVQAVRDDHDQMCVEISGPDSIEGELALDIAAKLVKLGWGLPRQPDADTPNFWREYPEDADFKLISKDAILGVAVAFPEAQFPGSGTPDVSLGEMAERVEQGEKVFGRPAQGAGDAVLESILQANGFEFVGETAESGKIFVELNLSTQFEPASKEEFYSAWQNYQAASFRCSKCKKNYLGNSLENDFQGLVLTLRCPKCHRKLLHLSVEASFEDIEQFAAEGSPTAIEHLEMMAKYEEAKEAKNESE